MADNVHVTWKAKRDFTRSGVTVKAGDLIPPYTFEADEVLFLWGAGFIYNPDVPQKAEPSKLSKPKADKPAKGATK
jgi:hypothetical protein